MRTSHGPSMRPSLRARSGFVLDCLCNALFGPRLELRIQRFLSACLVVGLGVARHDGDGVASVSRSVAVFGRMLCHCNCDVIPVSLLSFWYLL